MTRISGLLCSCRSHTCPHFRGTLSDTRRAGPCPVDEREQSGPGPLAWGSSLPQASVLLLPGQGESLCHPRSRASYFPGPEVPPPPLPSPTPGPPAALLQGPPPTLSEAPGCPHCPRAGLGDGAPGQLCPSVLAMPACWASLLLCKMGNPRRRHMGSLSCLGVQPVARNGQTGALAF